MFHTLGCYTQASCSLEEHTAAQGVCEYAALSIWGLLPCSRELCSAGNVVTSPEMAHFPLFFGLHPDLKLENPPTPREIGSTDAETGPKLLVGLNPNSPDSRVLNVVTKRESGVIPVRTLWWSSMLRFPPKTSKCRF